MAKYLFPKQTPNIDLIFMALSDPTRRNILERLTNSDLSVTEIAKPYGFALPTISKHLTVLEKANLVKKNKLGRQYNVHIEPQTMKTVAEYVAFYQKFWNKQIENLEKFLEREVKKNDK